MLRYYVRCRDCLALGVIESPLPRIHHADDIPRCPCGGRIEDMGRVVRQRLARAELETPCDDRCTGARGPNCNCKCGGENHGTGRVVEVLYDAGPIPRVALTPDLARAEEYRTARDAAKARITKQAERLENWETRNRARLWDPYFKAKALRTHAGRIKALARIGQQEVR